METIDSIFYKKKKKKKNVLVQLKTIYGIGFSKAKTLCSKYEINSFISGNIFSLPEFFEIEHYLNKELIVKVALKNQISDNIDLLKKIRLYRGVRHKHNLPVRGQRTHTNAKTCKKRRMPVRKFLKKKKNFVRNIKNIKK